MSHRNTAKHPHDEVIRAYLDGKPIQYRIDSHSVWEDLLPQYETEIMPGFHKFWEYRVKPEVAKYRVAMLKDSCGVYFTASWVEGKEEEEYIEQLWGFVRWVTDWVEVEV